jgi:hypothetical protein
MSVRRGDTGTLCMLAPRGSGYRLVVAAAAPENEDGERSERNH